MMRLCALEALENLIMYKYNILNVGQSLHFDSPVKTSCILSPNAHTTLSQYETVMTWH